MQPRIRPLTSTVFLLCGLSAIPPALAVQHLVHDPGEYATASAALQPGDTIVLADGVWKDFRILFKGDGTATAPITLTAQTPGQVVLSGQSDLRLAGQYLQVSNLVFRDGWAPADGVVSFRESSKARAVNSRVSGIVIDHYSKPDPADSDNWVMLYGHDNRFDHGHLLGKTNAGPTVVVVRDAAQGLDNRHQIDHVWFGPRPNLGANGGETIRVGTSTDSLSDSHTTVDHNWFEACDGEVEIVSNKSGGNLYRGNVFYRSRGALTLRHGNGNLVEGNAFLGGGKADTGGVRVINRDQTVRNNYFEGLAGQKYYSALSLMYGQDAPALSGYAQVDNARIENNTFVDVAHLTFGAGYDAGADKPIVLPPVNSRVRANLIVNGAIDPATVLVDLAGVAFSGNLQSPQASTAWPGGVSGRSVPMQRAASGLLVPATAVPGVGADPALAPVTRADTGVSWYAKDGTTAALDSGRDHPVAPGHDTLQQALAAAAPGDRLLLAAGDYRLSQPLAITRTLSLLGPAHGRAVLTSRAPSMFALRGGSLRLARLTLSGRDAPQVAGNALLLAEASARNYTLRIEDSRIEALDHAPGFDMFRTERSSLADLLALTRVDVAQVSGRALALAAESDDRGTYNADRVQIIDSRFGDVAGAVLALHRGGRDQSTFGPTLRVTGSRFARSGALQLHGVQHATLRDNRFVQAGGVRFSHQAGQPTLVASGNQFVGTPAIQSDTPTEVL